MPFSELNITVVIPTYNRAQKISATLDSFFSQSCESFEIIVVDDGSTDETQLILQSYLNRFRNRLKVIKTNNGERGRARNLGPMPHVELMLIFLTAMTLRIRATFNPQ